MANNRSDDETPEARAIRVEKKRLYRESRRKELAAKQREYYRANRESCLKYAKKYQEANKEKLKGYLRKYREENKERLDAKAKERWEKNPQYYRNKSKAYFEKNKEAILAKERVKRVRKKFPRETKGVSDQAVVEWWNARLERDRQERAKRTIAKQSADAALRAEKRRVREEAHRAAAEKREQLRLGKAVAREAAKEARRSEREKAQTAAAENREKRRLARAALTEQERASLLAERIRIQDAEAVRQKAKIELRLRKSEDAEERDAFKRDLQAKFVRERGWPKVPLASLSMLQAKTLSLHWTREKRKRIDAYILEQGSEDEKRTIERDLDRRRGKILSAKRESHERNREKINAKQKEWYRKNKDKVRERLRDERLNNSEAVRQRRKESYEKNKEKVLRRNRAYMKRKKERDPSYVDLLNKRLRDRRKTDGGKTTRRERNWRNQKKKTDIQYKLQVNLRKRLYMAIRTNASSGSAIRELGCSISFLKEQLENQFDSRMSWDSWAPDGWHIDHIYPITGADLKDPVERAAVLNWRNLRPVWGKENTSKGARITAEGRRLFSELKKEAKAKLASEALIKE